MTKVFKNILISLCGVFAFLFAGFFFVGCSVDYSKISLVADKQSVELEVGESAEIIFTIQNYQNGFSNKIQVNPRSDGQTAIFSAEAPVYISKDQIKVTITGVAGGNGELSVSTLEGGKECSVSVYVDQYSSSMEFDDTVLYVSNKTEFVPSPSQFVFDDHTTHKELSYYYLETRSDINFNTYTLTNLDFETNIASFFDGINYAEANIQKFDKVKLVKNDVNSLILSLDGVESEIDLTSSFKFLAVYDHSLNNDEYENIIYDVATVYVLPDINANVTGGYMDINTGAVDFQPLESDNIVIVPNNNHMVQYLLRIEMENSIAQAPIKMNKYQSNDYVDIDFYDFENEEQEDKTVYYLRISQNAQTQANTDLYFEIFYDIAQGIEDESVNVVRQYSVEIQIAPTALTVNGTSEPERLILYNFYRYPEFGWNDLYLDVISGYSSSPNYDGVYFTFDQTYLDIMYNGITINSGEERLFTDLSIPFKIRGKLGINQISNLVVTAHLKSDILQDADELTVDINCSIIAGATEVLVDENYTGSYFYLDYNGGEKNFDLQIYADHSFQYATYTFLSGVDVLDIDTNDDNPYTEVGDRYYINLSLTPKLTGIGLYRVYLDNGMPIDLTFNVVRTLSTDTTSIQLTSSGNEAVTEAYYSVEDEAEFENALNIEILNPSTKADISFGNVAQFTITANVNSDGVKYVTDGNGYISISKVNDYYRISTLDNGLTKITFTLSGFEIEDFRTRAKEIKLYVNVSSYSLIDEFYMKNGDNYALNNTVYFVNGEVAGGQLQEDSESITLTPVANNVDSMNFYQYFYYQDAFVDIFENADMYETSQAETSYIYRINNDQYYTEIVNEKYSRKFIYFYAQNIYSINGNDSYSVLETLTEVKVTKTYVTNGKVKTEEKNIMLVFGNGLMFSASGFEYIDRNEVGDVLATYTVEFSNVYSVETYGTFDIDAFKYTNAYQSIYSISLSANLRQRNSTKKYDCRVETSLYQSVESISLTTSLTQLDFSNSDLSYSLGVYTYPTNATNKDVRVEFVRTNGNPYVNMVTWDVETEDSNGVYTINLSCEDFFEDNKQNIVNIDDYLTGRIYIYPAEWGDSYSAIDASLQPIVIDVQYRNGSKANPYLLESAEDVVNINANETTLKSHYEISTVIDMSTVSNFTPIGILNENGKNVLYGFSGSIIGTNSQAAITNIAVSSNNFSAKVEKETVSGTFDILYAGLIAQLNGAYKLDEDDPLSEVVTPKIENVSFSGEFNLTADARAYVGLLTAVNRSEIVNVGVRIYESNIDMVLIQNTLYYGAVAGVNYGDITQDFTKYDGTGYNYKVYADNEVYKDENGNGYIIDDAGLKVYVDKEKYAIDENGDRIKYDEDGNVLLSSRDYTGQNTKNIAYYYGVVNINTASSNIYAGGIAGASSGSIKRISSSSLKLYGYSAYSAYTLISVTGVKNYNNYDKIYVGGAVGVASYNSGSTSLSEYLIDMDTPKSGNSISNLLVGGEINTVGANNFVDAVGGIVGFVDTLEVAPIDVLNNTSRVFLRAREYAGGIAGYDTYAEDYGNYTNFGTDNVVEAVDDGRNNFYASMIIKYKSLETLPADTTIAKNAFYSVGNSTRNGRSYASFTFTVNSYLKRNAIDFEENDVIYTNSSSTSNYYGDFIILNLVQDVIHIRNAFFFEFKEINLNLDESEFAMTQSGDSNADISVYFMYYFSVQGRLNQDGYDGAQDEIEDLNFITPNSKFYPFSLNSQDVNISSTNSNILSVDVNGNLTVKGTGLATVTLTSILNTVQSRVIYIYIVNYFDKDVSSSIFYTSGNNNGVVVNDDSNQTIYGNSNKYIYTVPTYNLSDGETYNGNKYTITANGVLNYKNVNYNLTKNTQVAVPSAEKTDFVKTSDTAVVSGKNYFVYDEVTGEYNLVENPVVEDIDSYFEQQYYSSVQINKQTIIFFKDKSKNPSDGDVDKYRLTPMLKVVVQVGSEKYEFYYELENSTINLSVTYRESATSIRTNSKYYSMQTNNTFKDTITVESTNKNEFVFYEIFYNGQQIQNRMPANLTQFDSASDRETAWLNYMNTINDQNDLFDVNFSVVGENVFEFDWQVNPNSKKFLNRFEENIYGEYTVYLYCSELRDGVSYSFKLMLDEAEINYVSINNYSQFNDISVSDEVVVPSQRGMLEISIDPVEAVFDEFSIRNNDLNYADGATEAMFTFAYEKISESASKEYVLLPTFGRLENGVFSFTYKEMTDLFNALNAQFEENNENASVGYIGKVYISYYMPSNNVDDGVDVGFDVAVTYGNESQYTMNSTIMLKTKLGSFAKLTFADKEEFGGVYYVARGLSYNLNLSYYGFSEDQISITSTNDFIANVSNVGGRYVLNVSSESINYSNDIGYKIEINTVASKIVDNVLITTTDTLTLYVMEYVLNYTYVDGVYEDIVKGMENGIITDAIGNPYTLEFSIRDFIEYDSSNAVVNKEVEDFISEMTQNIKWTVYLNNVPTELAENKYIRTDYYTINSYVVTPLRIYEAESDIYHFSASANYNMRNGLYYYTNLTTNSYPIYTEFSFDVHQQSTEDSPIPIETYEDFIGMDDGEWYILLNDITLPGSEYAAANGLDQFSPITANIAGFDGNGYALEMAGTYVYDDLNNFGVFASVAENCILQNVTVRITNDVVIRIGVSTFNVGLLASTNAGIITNASVESSTGNESLSVVCSTTAQTSYVAGLVSSNSGFITNSRSKINIFSNVNLSGFVGQNSGIISSSYYADSTLKNQTNTTSEYTAGFVISNSGEIHTSYVSGKMTSNLMFYYGEENSIQSNNNITGFVYTNNGSVEDCYSNITLRQSGAFASGFVFENAGTIARCFSTSVLESEQTSNYGFARYNNNENAVIEDCYYLSQREVYVADNLAVDINVSIGMIVLNENTDITPLNVNQFGKAGLEEFFSSYVVAEGRDINSVWFYNDNVSDLSNFNGAVFNTGRIELVAPNIVAFSQRELDRIETIVDPVTGATSAKYVYTYTLDSNPLGSVYNPILISDAETMENYILQESNSANYNYSYYRLIADVDYSDYLYNSNLYKTKFMGYLEGNFMSISGISMVSSEAMTSAGFFAELGSSSILDSVGTIMNFDLTPQSVSFANTDVVGALVGKVDNGKIFNVNVTRGTNQNSIVNGKNIVGGAVGLAIGKYNIKNLYSQYSAKARYQSASNEFNSNLVVYSSYSFAGSLIGVVSGTGSVYNSVSDSTVSVLADKAGLLFGLIDQNANVEKVYITMQPGMIVNAYSYGGLVVGESKGIVNDVTVEGFDEVFEGFKKIPSMPTALGGYAGLISGGIISDVSISQSISISNQSASDGVRYLGGLGGMVSGATEISNVNINSNLTGFTYVGGVIGYVNVPSNTIYFTDVNVTSNLYVYGHRLIEAGLGGLVGYVGEGSIISLDSSKVEGSDDQYKTNTFNVSANSTIYLYGANIEIYVGGIVGANKSSISHSILNADISLTGVNQAFDMSQTFENLSLSATVIRDEESSTTDLQIDKVADDEDEEVQYQTIYATSLSSTNVRYYCNISFETANPKQNIGSYLRLNLYGDAYIPE